MPLVILAGCATVIASQAVITGAFSLTQQAINLGLLPRLKVRHTSEKHSGQIYMPQVNYLLMAGVILLVFMFQSSSALAAAYGISVTGTMVVTAIMVFFVTWQVWEWPLWKTVAIVGPFILIDCIFLGSNLLKIADGGWMPIGVAIFLMTLMVTWIKGSFIINGRAHKRDVKIEKFIATWQQKYPELARVKGSAFFLTSDSALVPPSLVQNLRHNKVLHERNFMLCVKTETVPFVSEDDRTIVTKLSDDFTLLVMRFGFKEIPDVLSELHRLNRLKDTGVDFDWEKTSVFLSRKALRSHPRYGLPSWQDWIYTWLNRNAADPSDFYRLPTGRVIEIGRHVII